jgi:hypothetical protein
MPAADGQFTFQIQGQAGALYQIQTSTDLVSWTSNATVTLTGTTATVTNAINSGAEFWRAIWLP